MDCGNGALNQRLWTLLLLSQGHFEDTLGVSSGWTSFYNQMGTVLINNRFTLFIVVLLSKMHPSWWKLSCAHLLNKERSSNKTHDQSIKILPIKTTVSGFGQKHPLNA